MKTLQVFVLSTVLALSGCTAIKIAFVQTFVDQVITGKWVKDGTTPEDYYRDNWDCQKITSHFDPQQGQVFDLKAYYNCMIGKGWKLTILDISPLVK
jgi:hypothetical protein